MKKHVKCENYGACTRAGKVFVIDDEEHKMVCEECDEPLTEVKEPVEEPDDEDKKKKKRMLITLIGSLLVLVLLGLGIYFGVVKPSQDRARIEAEQQEKARQDSIENARIHALEQARQDSIAKAEALDQAEREALEQALRDSLEKVRLDSIEKARQDSIVKIGKTHPQPGGGTLKLSYGTYKGDTKNGYPHGQGRLTYSRSRQINRYDQKGRTAEAGDYVMGEFVNGFFVNGRHYSRSGELIESIMVGVPAGNSYEQK